MCGVTMRDRYPCEELRAWVGIKPIVDVMRERCLGWFAHIERRVDNSWLKKVQILAVDGHSGRGRPRKTWEHVTMEELRVKGLKREVAQNRAEWRSATTCTVYPMLAWDNNGLKNDDDAAAAADNDDDDGACSITRLIKMFRNIQM